MGTEFSLRGSHDTRLSHPLVNREQRVTEASSRHVTFSGTKWSGWEPTHKQLLTGSVVNLSPRLKWKPGIWARQSHQTHESVRQLKQGLRNKKMHSTLPTPSIQGNSPRSQWDKKGSPKIRLRQKWLCLWSLGCEQTFLLAGSTLSIFTWVLWIWTQDLMIWKCSYPMNHLPSPWESNSLES